MSSFSKTSRVSREGSGGPVSVWILSYTERLVNQRVCVSQDVLSGADGGRADGWRKSSSLRASATAASSRRSTWWSSRWCTSCRCRPFDQEDHERLEIALDKVRAL